MTSTLWPLVELAAHPLDRDEREAVLGDSLEAGDGAWQALSSVLGLVFRRQLLLWKSWRPWLATLVFGLPGAYLLMIVSLSVTCTYDRLMGMQVCYWAPTGHEGFALLLCQIFLLVAWSWATGFTLGSLSPRTLWVNASIGVILDIFCASCMLPVLAVSRFSPFLFLLPVTWGALQGMRTIRLRLAPALLLAVTITVLMITAWTNSALWIVNWLLICPAWYLVATAGKSDDGRETVHQRLKSSL